MNKKLNASTFHQKSEYGSKKITVYMNEGHKWLIKELAHMNEQSQKDVLYDIIQHYWDYEVPHTKKKG